MLHFVKSVIKIMRLYDNREQFTENMPQVSNALTALESRIEVQIQVSRHTRQGDIDETIQNTTLKLGAANHKEVLENTLTPDELERIQGQLQVTARHKNIFQAGENGSAYLRFLTNRSLNLKKWKTGSNNYDSCVYCK